MKREKLEEQLKGLITDETKRKEVIDNIMKINGDDIEKAKGELETIKAEKKQLEGELTTANITIDDLKQSQGDNATLQAKLTEYENSIKTMKSEHEAELTKLARESLLTKALGKYKAKNEIAVKALIGEINAKDDKDYETLLDNRLKELSSADDTKFMFGEQQVVTHYNPDGGDPAPTKGYGETYAESRNTVATPAYNPWTQTSAVQTK